VEGVLQALGFSTRQDAARAVLAAYFRGRAKFLPAQVGQHASIADPTVVHHEDTKSTGRHVNQKAPEEVAWQREREERSLRRD
jgi:hypothetical protein